MGVKGLWRLLLPIGRRISIESLEGKTLAIDASIWLTQFCKAMRDSQTGKIITAAHLIGFLRRLCRLRYHRIKPILVFDGAAPEIKKREIAARQKRRQQFASLSQGAVQRLAKKLLAETLQQQKQTLVSASIDRSESQAECNQKRKRNDAGAFLPGFNLGGDHHDDEQEYAPTEDKKQRMLALEKDTTQVQFDADLAASMAYDDNLLSCKSIQKHNDWDIPLHLAVPGEPIDQKQQGLGIGEAHAVKYEEFNASSKRNIRDCAEDEFSIDRVASMSSIQRKDAIERARREQRLESRKHFMPAAADPQKFSSVQLQNFLKSSKLNKDIAKMAQNIASRDGGVMASDWTTRVELIRENKPEKNSTPKCNDNLNRSDNFGSAPQILLKAKLSAHKGPHQSSNIFVLTRHQYQKRRHSRVLDDNIKDSDSDDCSSDSRLVDKKGNIFADGNMHTLDSTDLIDSDDESPRTRVSIRNSVAHKGLLVNDPPTPERPNHSNTSTLFELSCNTFSDSTTNSENFASQNGSKSANEDAVCSMTSEKYVAVADCKRNNDEDGGFVKVSKTRFTDSSIQFAQDHAKVPTLQDDEDSCAHHVVKRSQTGTTFPVKHLISFTSERASLLKSETSASDETRNATLISTLADASRRFASNETLQSRIETVAETFSISSRDDEDDLDWEDGAANVINDVDLEEAKLDDGHHLMESEVSFVDWNIAELPYPDKQVNHDCKLVIATNNVHSTIHTGSSQSAQSALISSETSAALHQAQVTATNLTNWAGRAFRRAMKEVGAPSEASVIVDITMPTPGDDGGVTEKIHDTASLGYDQLEKTRVKEAKALEPLISSYKIESPAKDCEDEVKSRSPRLKDIHNTTAKNEVIRFADSFDPIQGCFYDSVLQQNETDWTAERNRRERDMDIISDEMLDEVKQLLQLFGVPYLEAPAEAEAQCVALEKLGLVDGIVTEDSDVFVFGGKMIYRHIFEEQKYTEVYSAVDAEREMGLGHNAMVALAMLLGGDYTEGVKGVGIVNAMEILDTFDVSSDLTGGLISFKKWLDGFDPSDSLSPSTTDQPMKTKHELFHAKHRSARTRWVADEFPSQAALKAYLSPVVCNSKEHFSWGTPNLDNLILFCNRHIGWKSDETKHLLNPVLYQLQSGMRQTRIDSFMRYEDSIKFADIRSKRLREVLSLKNENAVKVTTNDEE